MGRADAGGFSLGSLDTVAPEDLSGKPLMISGRKLMRNELTHWFGDALCIRPDCTYPGLRFIPLSPTLGFGSVLVWKKNQIASPAVSEFVAPVQKCSKGISPNIG